MATETITLDFQANTAAYMASLQQAQMATQQLSSEAEKSGLLSRGLRGAMSTVAPGAALGFTAAGATIAGARSQQQFAGLRSTASVLQGTSQQVDFRKLSGSVKSISRDFGVASGEAVAMVNALQQVGVRGKDAEDQLDKLARTSQKIGQATGASGAEIASGFGQLSKQFNNLDPNRFKKMGDSLTYVSKAMGTSAESVTQFSQGIAPFAKEMGLTQKATMGISAAFTTLGQDSGYAQNAIAKMMSDISRSVRDGTGDMRLYADVAGMTADNFKQLVENDPSGAIVRLTKAMAEPGQGGRALERLGIGGIRSQRALQALIQSGGLEEAIGYATGSEAAGATGRGAVPVQAMLSTQVSRLRETGGQLAETVGRPLLGVTGAATQGITAAIQPAVKLLDSPVGQAMLTGLGVAAIAKKGAMAAAGAGVFAQAATSRLIRSPFAGWATGSGQSLVDGELKGERRIAGFGSKTAREFDEHYDKMTDKQLAGANRGYFARLRMNTAMDRVRESMGLGPIYQGGPGGIGAEDARPRVGVRARAGAFMRQAAAGAALGGTAWTKFAYEEPWRQTSRMWYDRRSDMNLVRGSYQGTELASKTYQAMRDQGKGSVAATAAATKTIMAYNKAHMTTMRSVGMLGKAAFATARAMGSAALGGLGSAAGMLGRGAMGLLGGPLGALMAGGMGAAWVAGKVKEKREKSAEDFAPFSMRNQIAEALGEEGRSAGRPMELSAQVDTLLHFAKTTGTVEDAISKLGTASFEAAANLSNLPELVGIIKEDANAATQQLINQYGSTGITGKEATVLAAQLMQTGYSAPEAKAIVESVAGSTGGEYAYDPSSALITRGAAETSQGWWSRNVWDSGYGGRVAGGTAVEGIAEQMEYDARTQGPAAAQANAEQNALDTIAAAVEANWDVHDIRNLTEQLAELTGMDWLTEVSYASGYNQEAFQPGATKEEVLENLIGVSAGSQKEDLEEALEEERRSNLNQPGDERKPWEVTAEKININAEQNPIVIANTADEDTALGQAIAGQARDVGVRWRAGQELNAGLQSQGLSTAEGAGNLRVALAFATSEEELLAYQEALTQRNIQMQVETAGMGPTQQWGARTSEYSYLASLSPEDAGSDEQRAAIIDAKQQMANVYSEMVSFYAQIAQVQDNYNVSRKRAEEDYARQMSIQRRNFNRDLLWQEQDHNKSVRRQREDFNLQFSRQVEDFAKSALNVFERYGAREAWGGTALSGNLGRQNEMMQRQLKQLDQLRQMGLSEDAIRTMDLTNPQNYSQVNQLYHSLNSNPDLVDQLNSQVMTRLDLAGEFTEQSPAWQRSLEDFERGLDRQVEDYTQSVERSKQAFNQAVADSDEAHRISLARMSQDLQRTLDGMYGKWQEVGKQMADQAVQTGNDTREGVISGLDGLGDALYKIGLDAGTQLQNGINDGSGGAGSPGGPGGSYVGPGAGNNVTIGTQGGRSQSFGMASSSGYTQAGFSGSSGYTSGGAQVSRIGDNTINIPGYGQFDTGAYQTQSVGLFPKGTFAETSKPNPQMYGPENRSGNAKNTDAALKFARKAWPGLTNASGFARSNHSPNSRHYVGKAIDLSLPHTRAGQALGTEIAAWFAKNWSVFGTDTIIWNKQKNNLNGKGWQWYGNGNGIGDAPHINHVHVSLLEKGGVVRGPKMAVVGEAGPEAVLPLNNQGAAYLIDTLRRYMAPDEARAVVTAGHDVPVLNTSTSSSTSYDQSMRFMGPITVNSDTPEVFESRMRARQRSEALRRQDYSRS